MSDSVLGDVESILAPLDVFDRLDELKVCAALASVMTDDEKAANEGNRCRWYLEGFDELGIGQITLTSDRGERVAWALVHWSTIVVDA